MTVNELLTELSQRNVKLWCENDELGISAPKGALTENLIQSLKDHKTALLTLLRLHNVGKTNALPLIVPDPEKKEKPFPLTPIQQAYWLGRKGNFEGGKISTHLYLEIDSCNLDVQRLEKAWQKLVVRHDMLRTIALPYGEQQVLKQVPDYLIKILDLQGLEKDISERKCGEFREEMSHQVLSIEKWPAFDIRVARFDQLRWRIYISIDLFIADFGSLMRLLYEWTKLYQSPNTVLPVLELSFRDYVLAEKELIKTDIYKRSQTYWFERLDHLPPPPPLPLVKNPNFSQQPHFKRHSSQLSGEEWSRLKQKASELGLTPSGLLLAAFAEILTIWSNSSQFTLNLTFHNRLPFHPQVELIVGNTISVILLAIDNSQIGSSFSDRSRKLQQQLWQDLDNIYISGIEVLRELARRKDNIQKAQMPIVFTSVLGVEESSGHDPTVINQLGEVIYSISQTPQVWLDHQVTEEKGKLVFNWDVVEELFPKGMVDDMFASYCQFLQQLVNSDEVWHQTNHKLLPKAQLEKFAEVNATDTPISPLMLHELFTVQATAKPHAIAIISGEYQLTYQEVYCLANQVGQKLRQLGAKPNQLVAIVMEKGWEQIVAALAILLSGAAYLPIDPQLPPERLQYLLQQGEVKLILTQSHLQNEESWMEGISQICLDDQEFSHENFRPLASVQTAADLAYVIYTSGSTGNPKGVMQTHIGPVNTVLDINHRFDITSEDRVLALSSLSFDLSVYDIFGTLAAGGTLIIPASERTKDPKHWTELIIKHHVTVWNSVPYFMQMLTEYLSARAEKIPADLRLIFLSGDRIPRSLVAQIQAIGETVSVIGLGGPTETSIWNVCYPIQQINPDATNIPYGKPISNQHYYVLNSRLESCPIWVHGQLYAGGIGLAKGYWQDIEKTENSFITHPETGERIYKTGDLGRYLPDGNIEILGREDFQVKINGYRIELGEIETGLKQHYAIKDAIASVVTNEQGSRYLVAYVLLNSPSTEQWDILKEQLGSSLKEKLPDYMLPCNYIQLESWPLNVNGKIDRLALPLPNSLKQELAFVAPTTSVEIQLADLWSEFLKVEQISIHDNFFKLGGDSLLATRIIFKIQEMFAIEIDFVAFFETPTIASLANYIETVTWAIQGLEPNSQVSNIEEVEF